MLGVENVNQILRNHVRKPGPTYLASMTTDPTIKGTDARHTKVNFHEKINAVTTLTVILVKA